MKKTGCLLLAALLCVAMAGCVNDQAAVFCDTMLQGMRGKGMSYTLQIQYPQSGGATKSLHGEGTATDLFGAEMLMEANYATYHSQASTGSTQLGPGGPRVSVSSGFTSQGNDTQLNYRNGFLYFADVTYDRDGAPSPNPESVRIIPIGESLLESFQGGTVPAGAFRDVVLEGRELRCGVAPDSELGKQLSELMAYLDNGGTGGNDSAIRLSLTADEDGRLQKAALTVERATFVTSYEITLVLYVTAYGGVEPIVFPGYVN